MLVTSGAGGKTHSVGADGPAEARKGRDERRQVKIDRIWDAHCPHGDQPSSNKAIWFGGRENTRKL